MLVVRKLSTEKLHIVKNRFVTFCGANHYRNECGFHIVQELADLKYKPCITCQSCEKNYKNFLAKG